jgi:ankyrin repeat protein
MEAVLSAGAAASPVDNAGFTPLHIASQNGYLEIVKALLKRDDCNVTAWVDGQTAKSLATAPEVVSVLADAVRVHRYRCGLR